MPSRLALSLPPCACGCTFAGHRGPLQTTKRIAGACWKCKSCNGYVPIDKEPISTPAQLTLQQERRGEVPKWKRKPKPDAEVEWTAATSKAGDVIHTEVAPGITKVERIPAPDETIYAPPPEPALPKVVEETFPALPPEPASLPASPSVPITAILEALSVLGRQTSAIYAAIIHNNRVTVMTYDGREFDIPKHVSVLLRERAQSLTTAANYFDSLVTR